MEHHRDHVSSADLADEHTTMRMASLDRLLLLERTLPEHTEVPTVRIPIVWDEVGDEPRAPAPGVTGWRVRRALGWGAWGMLLFAPAFSLSC